MTETGDMKSEPQRPFTPEQDAELNRRLIQSNDVTRETLSNLASALLLILRALRRKELLINKDIEEASKEVMVKELERDTRPGTLERDALLEKLRRLLLGEDPGGEAPKK